MPIAEFRAKETVTEQNTNSKLSSLVYVQHSVWRDVIVRRLSTVEYWSVASVLYGSLTNFFFKKCEHNDADIEVFTPASVISG